MFCDKVGWYPVSGFGWFLTLVYFLLLCSLIALKYFFDLDSNRIDYLHIAFLAVGFVVVILVWARQKKEQPFRKKVK